MARYRRLSMPGAIVFLTVVTHERRPILCEPTSRRILRHAMAEVRARRPFGVTAAVLLPDHLHVLMQLPEDDHDYSTRIGGVKHAFTRAHLACGGWEGSATPGRRRQRYRGVWQKRFHDHVIRDDRDLERHVDYIHYNPVKHELVARAVEWPWSSFHRYIAMGLCHETWFGPAKVEGLELPHEFE